MVKMASSSPSLLMTRTSRALQVVVDGVSAGVDAQIGQLLAQGDDLFLDRRCHPRR
jgi:hypothetical protein